MTRLQQILAALLVVQVAVAAALFWPRTAASGAGAALIPVKSEDIVSVNVRDGQGQSTKLTKTAGGWVLPDADDFPADASKVTALLGKLVDLRGNRLVTRTESSQARLKVADTDFERRIEFATSGGANYTVFLGTSPGARTTHFRLAGQAETYLASAVVTYDVGADAAGWIDPLYVNVPAADVAGFTLQNAAGNFRFARSESGTWSLEGFTPATAGEQLNQNAIGTALQGLTTLRMLKPLGKQEQPAYGMSQPAAVVTLVTKGSTTPTTVTVGTLMPASGEGGQAAYTVKSSTSPYYVSVGEYALKDLVAKQRSDFVQQPTPAPTSGPAGNPLGGQTPVTPAAPKP